MAKKKRVVVGSVCKPMPDKVTGQLKDTDVDYIKMRDGKTFYRLESPAYQLKSLEKAVAEGKLTGDVAESVRERIEKIPPFVRFEVIQLVDAE